MSFNDSVSEFYEVLGPFHEFLPQESNGDTNGSPETPSEELNSNNENMIDTKSEHQISRSYHRFSNEIFCLKQSFRHFSAFQ